jgi:hypothetical protein
MALPKAHKAGETCRPHRLTMPQRFMVAQQEARVTPVKSTSERVGSKIEISHRWPIRQSHSSKIKKDTFLLMFPIFPPTSQSLLPLEDEGSRRVCEAGAFRDEFLSGDESSRDDIIRKVSMDSEEDQDIVFPAYQVRPSSIFFRLKMRPRSFIAQPSEHPPPANLLAAKLLPEIDVPNASTAASPSATPRQELPSLPLSPPALKRLDVFDYDYTRETIPQDLMLPFI